MSLLWPLTPLRRFPRPMRRSALAYGVGRTLAAWRSFWAAEDAAEKQAALARIDSLVRAMPIAQDGLVEVPERELVVVERLGMFRGAD